MIVNTLGKFCLLDEEKTMDEDVMRSEMLTKLLIYMLLHRDYPITIQELSEALWDEDETENPAGALKNLMYRLRNLLKKNLGEGDYILSGQGVYYWNPQMKVALDVEQFEQYCDLGKRAKDPLEKKTNYEKAIALYKGDFMPKIADKHWAVTLSVYYHSTFLSAVKELSEIYMIEERYEKVEEICRYGLQFDSVDEWLHCQRITALMKQNKQTLAMECYEQASKVLYDKLGVRKSAQLDAVHQELLKMNKGNEAEAIENVQENLVEDNPNGAFLCGYPVFREIYRLEARKISRLGQAEYIMLLTIQCKEKSGVVNSQMEKFLINQAMNQLEATLKETLRIGDVVARYSDSQFVVLLPACSYENGCMIGERIRKRFQDKEKGKRINVIADFEEVTMASSLIH